MQSHFVKGCFDSRLGILRAFNDESMRVIKATMRDKFLGWDFIRF